MYFHEKKRQLFFSGKCIEINYWKQQKEPGCCGVGNFRLFQRGFTFASCPSFFFLFFWWKWTAKHVIILQLRTRRYIFRSRYRYRLHSPRLSSLALPVVGEGKGTFNSNSAELLLVLAPTSSGIFIGEVQGVSAREGGKMLGTRLIARTRTKESKTSFWLGNLWRKSVVIIRLSWGGNPWNRHKASYIFKCHGGMFRLVGPAFFN